MTSDKMDRLSWKIRKWISIVWVMTHKKLGEKEGKKLLPIFVIKIRNRHEKA